MLLVMKGMELEIHYYVTYPPEENELLARLRTPLRCKQYQDGLSNELEESFNLLIKDWLIGVFRTRYYDIHIIQMVKRASESNRPLCSMMFVIDRFKIVNDTHGHQAENELFKGLYTYFRKRFRVTIWRRRICRSLCETSIEEAMLVTELVRSNIEALEITLPSQAEHLKETTSIGVSECKPDETVTSFVERTDEALYGRRNRPKQIS